QIAHASKGKARRFRKKFRKRQERVTVAGGENSPPAAAAEAEELEVVEDNVTAVTSDVTRPFWCCRARSKTSVTTRDHSAKNCGSVKRGSRGRCGKFRTCGRRRVRFRTPAPAPRW